MRAKRGIGPGISEVRFVLFGRAMALGMLFEEAVTAGAVRAVVYMGLVRYQPAGGEPFAPNMVCIVLRSMAESCGIPSRACGGKGRWSDSPCHMPKELP